MITKLIKGMHNYFLMIITLTTVSCLGISTAFAQSCSISGASSTLYGQPCGKVDVINSGSTGSLTGLTNGSIYKYSIAAQTPNQVVFNGLKINGNYVNQNTYFTFVGPSMNLEWDLTVPCNWSCGFSRTITLFIKSGPVGTVICSKVYTIKAPLNWLTASPATTNCSNVPVTVTFNSQAGANPNCVFTVHNSNYQQWTVNGSGSQYVTLLNGSSVTVANTSNTNSSTTITFYDGSACNCCPYICRTSSITLTSLVSPVANAGTDKYHCCYATLGTPPQPNTTYSWSPTTGLSNPNIAQPTTYATNITYTLTSTYTPSGCTAQDQVYVGFMSGNCCRLEDGFIGTLSDKPGIKIFPNPSNDYFVLDLSELDLLEMENKMLTLEVVDILGKTVLKVNDINQNDKFHFGHDLPAGVYHVIIKNDKSYSLNIIKN